MDAYINIVLGRAIDVSSAASEVNAVKRRLHEYRENVDICHDDWYAEALLLAKKVNVQELMPRNCSRMTHRSNVDAESASTYYKRTITIPMLG